MTRGSWKRGERRIAAWFGCRRTPLSGRNSGHTAADVIHPRLFVECKHRKHIPFEALWRETKELADKEGKVPLLVFTQKGSHYPLVLVALEHLQAVAREIKQETDDARASTAASP